MHTSAFGNGMANGWFWHRFPKQPKDAIKETLNVVAERVGMREKDKVWVVRS